MSTAVLWKTLRDSWVLLVVLVAATVLLETLEVYFVREMLAQFEHEFALIFLKNPFIRKVVASALGADLSAEITPTNIMTIGFSHPLMYTFMCVLVLTIGTRALVGEIDRGTADLLLTLPVSRVSVYLSV